MDRVSVICACAAANCVPLILHVFAFEGQNMKFSVYIFWRRAQYVDSHHARNLWRLIYPSLNYLSSATYLPIQFSVVVVVGFENLKRVRRRIFPSHLVPYSATALPPLIARWLNTRLGDPQRKNRLPAVYPKRYYESSRCGSIEFDHPRRYSNGLAFLVPTRDNDHPYPFLYGCPSHMDWVTIHIVFMLVIQIN